MNSIAQSIPPELEEKIKELAKPGVVFSEPVQAGEYTLITASRYKINKSEVTARPVGVILISQKGVKIRYFRNAFVTVWAITMLATIVFWTSMILHPPWKPEVNLLDEVADLIETIRSQ